MIGTESPSATASMEQDERTPRVPSAFLVQLAASQAGIGPFAGRDRETPFIGARRYYEGMARRRPPLKFLRSA
ncbi:hypothetical protein ACQKLX_02910 [Bosea sp. NPDC003192]|jgi:hypothetical protein|uniref:hypothetical protein n=1 Tax=Bosea sp. NPDC003192 TaxID=3390551 RepID=UPI003D0256C5